MEKTKISLNIDTKTWEALKEIAEKEKTDATGLINKAMKTFVRKMRGGGREPSSLVIDGKKHYPTNELMEILNLSKPTLIKYIKKGLLKACMLRGTYYVSENEIKIFMAKNIKRIK